MIQVADIIADVLHATSPFSLGGRKGDLSRAKVDFTMLEDAKLRVRALTASAGMDFEPSSHGYPHFYYLDDYDQVDSQTISFDLGGDGIRQFLNYALASDVEALHPGESQSTKIVTPREVNGN
jgi:glycine hydroxymethyltransferase